jgi:hypothetical protein
MAGSTTNVTGTATDSQTTPYINGTWVANLFNPTSFQPVWGGTTNFTTTYGGALDNTGSFAATLPSNTGANSITVGGLTTTQWTFAFFTSDGENAFTATVTITGANQSISASIINAARIFWETGDTNPPPCGTGQGIVSLGTGTFGCGGGSFPVTTIVNVSSGGGIQPTGTGFVNIVPVNTPITQSQVGPGFNVKNYGAKGDTQFSAANCTLNGTATLVCPGANFNSAKDVGKRVNCGSGLGGGLQVAAGTTIASVTNSTTVVMSNVSGQNNNIFSCAWGTVDDVAVNAAVTAWLAAASSTSGQRGPFNNNNNPQSPVLYFPAGAYMLCGSGNSIINFASSKFGAVVTGDAPQESWLVPCDIPNMGGNDFFVQQSGTNGLVIRNLSIDGMFFPEGGANAFNLGGDHRTENVTVTRWNGANGFLSAGGGGYNLNMNINNSIGGIFCSGCNDEFHAGGSSNNGTGGGAFNLKVQNVVGENTGTGARFTGNFLIDECGASTNGCTQILNSQDVWFQGASLFSTPSSNALYVDGTSFVHMSGGIAGCFGTDAPCTGVNILAGGVVQSSDVRYVGSGTTGKCINNAGIFNDNGGNSCETQFTVNSGTSTGTAAVLTVNAGPGAPNTLCTVGDALIVEGVSPAGYNGYYPAGATSGVTAVSGTTISYTTAGSNLGAAGAGGIVTCRNLQTYAGTLPKALLNNPIPNTCYLTITPIVNATTYQMCNWGAGSPTNISRITASSQNVTTCATAPIITISNGTVSQTLTLTSGKQFWDSFAAQDASTGVGTTIFKPSISLTGTDRITIKYDAGALSACATPPTLLAVSYTISPILSN